MKTRNFSARYKVAALLSLTVLLALPAQELLARGGFEGRSGGGGFEGRGGGGGFEGRAAGGQRSVQSAAPSSVRGSQNFSGNQNANANRNVNANQNLNANQNVNANRNVNANANANVNQNVNANRNVNANQNVNVNQNTNVNYNQSTNVNVNSSYHVNYNDDWDNGAAFVAGATVGAITGAAVASASQPTTVVVAAPVTGTVFTTLPAGCVSATVNGASFFHCGSVYYRPQYSGGSVTYVVAVP